VKWQNVSYPSVHGAGVHLLITAIHDNNLIMGYLENKAADQGANMPVRPSLFEHCI
jgi:hypothetical protein